MPVSVEWCLTRRRKPAPITFYRYEDLPALFEVLSRHVGRKVAAKKLNVSPERTLDVERSCGGGASADARSTSSLRRIPFVGR